MALKHALLINLPSIPLILNLIGFLMRLFRTSEMEVIKFRQSAFNIVLPSVQIVKIRDKFVKKINAVPMQWFVVYYVSYSLKT